MDDVTASPMKSKKKGLAFQASTYGKRKLSSDKDDDTDAIIKDAVSGTVLATIPMASPASRDKSARVAAATSRAKTKEVLTEEDGEEPAGKVAAGGAGKDARRVGMDDAEAEYDATGNDDEEDEEMVEKEAEGEVEEEAEDLEGDGDKEEEVADASAAAAEDRRLKSHDGDFVPTKENKRRKGAAASEAATGSGGLQDVLKNLRLKLANLRRTCKSKREESREAVKKRDAAKQSWNKMLRKKLKITANIDTTSVNDIRNAVERGVSIAMAGALLLFLSTYSYECYIIARNVGVIAKLMEEMKEVKQEIRELDVADMDEESDISNF